MKKVITYLEGILDFVIITVVVAIIVVVIINIIVIIVIIFVIIIIIIIITIIIIIIIAIVNLCFIINTTIISIRVYVHIGINLSVEGKQVNILQGLASLPKPSYYNISHTETIMFHIGTTLYHTFILICHCRIVCYIDIKRCSCP